MIVEKRSREFAVPHGTEVIIRNSNGSVLVRGGAATGVITAIRRPGPELPHTRFFEPEVEEGPPLVLKCSYSCSRVQASVDLEIDLPAGVKSVMAETVNGNIVLVAPGCPATAATHNGFVRLTGPAGEVSLATRNGSVDVSGRCSISSISVLNGEIRADISDIASSGAAISTTTGSISLRIAADLPAELDSSTGRGVLSFEGLNIGSPSVGALQLRGLLAGGGPQLAVRARIGDLKFSKLE